MRGSADEIDRALAQRRVTLVDGVDQLERNIEAFLLEATELDRGDRGEIRVRDHVGHGELHVSNSSFSCGMPSMSCVPLRATRARSAYSWCLSGAAPSQGASLALRAGLPTGARLDDHAQLGA